MNVLPHVLNRGILRFRSLILVHMQEARGDVNSGELTYQQAIFGCVPSHSEFLHQEFAQVETPIKEGGVLVRRPKTLQERVSCSLISSELGTNEVCWRVLKSRLDGLHWLNSLERRLKFDS